MTFSEFLDEVAFKFLHKSDCEACRAKDEEIQRLVNDRNHLLSLLSGRPVHEEVQEITVAPQAIRPRHTPWFIKRREIEKRKRQERKEKEENDVKPVLTEAEAIFEKSIHASN